MQIELHLLLDDPPSPLHAALLLGAASCPVAPMRMPAQATGTGLPMTSPGCCAWFAVDTLRTGLEETGAAVKEINDRINDTSYLDRLEEGVPPGR